MAIVGEELQGYVINQINARQKLHGSGAGPDVYNVRNDQQINLLNSNTSWVKLASGISVSEDRLKEIDVDPSLSGMGLAKRYILSSGFSRLEGERLKQREGFLPQQPDSSYTYGTYGYSPMPGIENVDIKALNRGSLKKATVKIKANNKQQFDILELLYMRLGYTVLLEWGNSLYTPDGVTREVVRGTLVEDPQRFFSSGYGSKKSYRDILGPIEYYKKYYACNYDALLGKVSNFSWAFNTDGSYDIEITIISLGDVVESLKLNISSDKSLTQFVVDTTATSLGTFPSSGGSGGGGTNFGGDKTNVKKALKYLIVNKGVAAPKAIGIIAAIMGESGPYLNPNALNSSSKAFGIAQWLGKRKQNLQTVAASLSKTPNDLLAQLEFLYRELTPGTGYTDTIADGYIKKSVSKEETLAAMTIFERWGYIVGLYNSLGGYNKVYDRVLQEVKSGSSPDKSLQDRINYLAVVKDEWEKGDFKNIEL
jgi:hypothetical protein